jgi:hypothetical protein
MLDQRLHIFFTNCVEDVEKVFPIRQSAFRKFVWEKSHDLGVHLYLRPNILDGELVVGWDVDLSQDLQIQELLLFLEELGDEVLVDHLSHS